MGVIMNKTAYSLMTIKSVNEEKREIRGIATTISPDRMNDVVEPSGAKFQLPIPLLWQHKHDKPIGSVTEATVTEAGIEIVASIPKGVTEDIENYWSMIKSGLVRGLSIGFRPLEYSYMDDGGIKFTQWEWYELSAVTVPANADATIQLIKSIASGKDTASGEPYNAGNQTQSAASGKTKAVNLNPKKDENMSIQQQIKQFADKKAASMAQMSAIMQKAADEGRTLDGEEASQHDDLAAEVKSIDEHLKRLEAQATFEKQTAQPANTDPTFGAPQTKSHHIVIAPRHAEKGLAMAQVVRCLGQAGGNAFVALQVAESKKGALDPRVEHVLKAAVGAGSTSNSSWAGALVGDETSVYADFIEYLRPLTIIGQFGANGIPALRSIPFRVPLIGQSSGGEGYWTGESASIGLTQLDFQRSVLEPLKVGNIAVVTKELLANSSPSADALIRDQLAQALQGRLDADFINPAKAAVVGISPASILNGITGITSKGSDALAIDADVQNLFATFINANNAPTSGVWIMNANTALALSMMKNPLGSRIYPEMSMNGGRFEGLPAIVSQHVSAGLVALVNADDIYIGDEGGMSVDMSTEASLEMASDPSHNSGEPKATQLVSMFQTESVAFKAAREINWKRRRETSVAYLTGVKWGANVPAGAGDGG